MKIGHRLSALILCISMILTMLPTVAFAETVNESSESVQGEIISDTDYITQYRRRTKLYEESREELTAPWILYDTKSGSEHLGMRTTHAALDDADEMQAMYSACRHSDMVRVNWYFYTNYVTGSELINTGFYATEEEFMAMDALDTVGYRPDGKTYYRYTYCTEINHYTDYYYYMWTEWTEWGNTVYTADEDTEVETRKVYLVDYVANGGWYAPEDQYKVVGEDLKLSSDFPSRDDYVFLGWSTSSSGDAEYSVGDIYSVDAHITLFAVWKPVSECQAVKTYYRYREKIYKTSTEELDYPWILYDSETEYRHTGYNYITKPSTYFGVENSYCVHEKTYMLRYVNQNNSGQWFYATPSDFMNMSGTIVLTYSSDGTSYYRYKYCTEKVPYEIYYYYSWGEWSEWSETPIIESEDVEVETYSVEQFVITYDANGGVDAPVAQTKTSGVTLMLSEDIPKRESHVFLGWAESINGAVMYRPGDPYTIDLSKTLYAQWEIRYTITFDGNGGSGLPAAQVKIPGEDLVLADVEPTREFYKFLGWATTKDGAVAYLPGANFSTDENITLYAVWERDVSVVQSGVCGDSLTWELYNDGLLVISGSGTMYNYDSSSRPWSASDIRAVEISEGVISIGARAFYGCSNMTSIKLPNSLQYINARAFANCSGLREVFIPESVKQILEYAFSGCESMTSIHMPSYLEYPYIHEGTFYHCYSLAEITLPVNLQSIGYEAFRNCEGLQSITISKNLTRIGDEALYGCNHLEVIYYEGTSEQWESIQKGEDWDYRAGKNTSKGKYTIARREYTVSYNANGGEGAPTSQKKTQGIDMSLSEIAPTRAGYIFQGWATTPKGTLEYSAGDVFTLNDDVTLYAVWREPYTYTLNYDANGGVGTPPTQIKTENIAIAVSDITPVRVGYLFDYWLAGSILSADGLESAHNYANDTHESWVISSPGAKSIKLTFDSRTAFASYDYLYVYDDYGYCVASYTGSSLAGKTIEVQDDYVRLTLSADRSGTKWGFAVTSVVAYYPYNAGDSVTLNSDITFYATWTECTHEWDEGTITIEPTHTTAGESSHSCTICGATKTEEVAKIPEHTYGLWVDSGTTMHSKTCECGETVYADHSWDEGMITLQPTHTAVGVKTFACVDCNATRTEDVEKLSNHTYGEWQDTDYGYHQKICACGDAITENHTRDEGVVTREPTHTSTGIMTYTCVVCGNRATLTIAKQQHTFGEWTRISDTQHSRSCECGTVETKSHDFTEWQTQSAATCTENGVEYRSCQTCGAEETRTIMASGHNYVSVVTDPNCNEQGYTTHTCSCGDTYTDTYTDALGHRVLWTGTELVESYTTEDDPRYPFATDGGWYKSTNKESYTYSVFTISALYKCTLVLKYKVSCAEDGDYLKISVNENQKARIYGGSSEKEITLSLNEGDILTIKYYKMTRQSTYEDTGYFMIVSSTKSEVDVSKYISAQDVDPTCTDAVVCDICGHTVYAATGHMYDNDCDTDCNNCGATRVTTHLYGAWEKENAEDHKRACVCGHTEIEAHNWDSGVVTVEPTQAACGERKYTCADCSATRTEVIYRYIVTYDANGGANAPESQLKIQGTDLVLSENQPVRVGYVFQQWTSNITGDEEKILDVTGLESSHNYESSTNKEWTITSPGAKAIKLTFDSRTAFESKYDFLYVYDSSNACILTYSGTELAGKTIEVQGDTVKLLLTSDSVINKWGFAVTSATAYYDATYKPGEVYSTDADITLYAVWLACEHNWNGGEVTVQPTHATFGEQLFTCNDCAATKTEQVAKTPEHSYDSWTKVDSESHQRTCICGDVETKAHNWDSGEITTQPTHTTFGERTYTCKDCSASKTEQVAKTPEHSYGSWTPVDAENHQKTCACGDIVTKAHNWNEGVITMQPTHTTFGVRTYTCNDCSASKTEQVAKTPEHSYGSWTPADSEYHQKTCACGDVVTKAHNWNGGEVTVQPTHTTFGVRTYTCKDCAATKTEQVDKTPDHSYGEWTEVDADTHNRICACGKVETEAHEWDDGVIAVAPTQTSEGEMVFTCLDCGATRIEIIPMLPEYYIGDANGDGVVDTLDRMILSRYLANWDDYTADDVMIIAVDLNKDGVVDTLDRMILNRHLANWEGYEDILKVTA